MLLRLVGLGLALSVSPAFADDSDKLMEQVQKCWSVPVGVDTTKAKATFEVSFDASGNHSVVKSINYNPSDKSGEMFALSAKRAILKCANATDIKSKTIRLEMIYNPIALNKNGAQK